MGKKEIPCPDVPGWKPFQRTGQKQQLKEDDTNETRVDVPPNWKDSKFTMEDNPHKRLFACSSFSCLFPKYKEKYLRTCWPTVKAILLEHHIKADLDVVEGTMTVRTTPKTFDPCIILKARDLIRLLARSVPLEKAQQVLEDDVYADIIDIDLANRDRFIRRRERLIGPDGATLKAIELLTGCYVLIQGKTVSAIGPYKGLRTVRKIAQDTMNNIHPVYNIKTLLIKKKLESDSKLRDENWERFLPQIKNKTLSKRRKPAKIRTKGEYTPFPPPQPLSKVDQELEAGTYFLAAEEKARAKNAEKRERQVINTKKRQEQRALAFVPPVESAPPTKKRKKNST